VTRSATALLHRNGVEIDGPARLFRDSRTGSAISIDPDDRVVHFDVAADGARVCGSATALFDHPFTQSTGFHGGHGTLQTWGNLRLNRATLTTDAGTVALPAGSYGAYDRSLGHRRPLEAWNWIVAVGSATRASDGAQVDVALHAARDRPAARPQVEGRKFVLWVGDRCLKLEDLSFEYQTLDHKRRTTTPWRLRGTGDAHADLTFEPLHVRHDHHRVPLVFEVDHLQYFGNLSGDAVVDGETYILKNVFATTEDSRMAV
jgi:hypothetical protein